ncbi:MAG: protein kinase domain-containing protein [Acidobacteriota bacterium]
MSLVPGTRLGAYEVLTPIGAGGMGEVYRARDTRLKRDVAIKILPATFAADPDRLMRFEREAETLAALNHPHIAQIHGLEESAPPSDGSAPVRALVMEFVDGESLDARIERGLVPADEAVAFARQIADALEAAHAHGIVHRDLKPANVKVAATGVVKVLDFGLARMVAPGELGAGRVAGSTGGADASPRNSPTITSPAVTQAGVILGTAAYMSPEQARGRTVDSRSDLWALGCLLFEMLTATRAFDGETITDVLSAVVSKEPDWSLLPPDTPLPVRRLLRRCVKKDVRQRLQSAGDARVELEDALAEPGLHEAVHTIAPATRSWMRAAGLVGAGALMATVATFLLSGDASPGPAGPKPVLRFTINLPPGAEQPSTPAVSHDGRFVAVALREKEGTRRIWLRSLDGIEFQPVAGIEHIFTGAPFWSPDDGEIGYFVGGKLMRVRATGGVATEVADLSKILGTIVTSATWGADGAILFGSPTGIYRISSTGGDPVRLTSEGDAANAPATPADDPQWLPGQTGLVYRTLAGGELFQRPVAGGQLRRLLPSSGAITALRATRDGLLISRATPQQTTVLTAHRYDLVAGEVDTQGVVLATDLLSEVGASDTGVLVYRPARGGLDHQFEWVDASGRSAAEPFGVTGASPFNLSRDDTRLAFVEDGHIMVRDLARGVTSRVVQGPGLFEPILSPDSSRIAYARADTEGVAIVIRPTAGGVEEAVQRSPQPIFPEDWSADGRFLAAVAFGRGLIVPLEGDRTPVRFEDHGPGTLVDEPRFSPDGRWILYNATEGGRADVFLAALPPTGERWQVSVDGGVQGRWRRDGTVVYYLSASGQLMAVNVKTVRGQPPQIGRPRPLFDTRLTANPLIDQYAPNADGSRFLLRRPVQDDRGSELHVIVNWPTLLNTRPSAP